MTKLMYTDAVGRMPPPSGVNPPKNWTACGMTSQPSARPNTNSGTAAAMKPRAYFFSDFFSPGTMNAQIW